MGTELYLKLLPLCTISALKTYINSYFGIDPVDVDSVAELFVEETIKKGDFYLRSEQICEKMSFIESGFVRVFTEVNDKEVTQWIGSKGQFITDLSSFMFDQRARWHIQALTDCKVYTIRKAAYLQLNQQVNNWPQLEKQFIAACFVTLENRVFTHLAMSAEERYRYLLEQNKELFNQVPQQYIASMLGMTPETFSRIRSKMIS
ncbi:MAG: Crp/Fnr family transcriptional regulator [Putridiphycobacter sp.]|nr:Crp/Fnr family transcriptional regulator [Putridiphycobacter sp.]